MSNNILEYKGYYTSIHLETDTMTLNGKIEGINDLVTFQSGSIDTIENEFHAAVDDYLASCAEVGKEPERTYKGKFNVRISPELHQKVARKAVEENRSINSLVEIALTNYVS